MNLEEELTHALKHTIEVAKENGYVPSYFMKMLSEFGGVTTAKHLLASEKPQTGLFQLYELHLLSESLEAVVLRDKFRLLFTQEELDEAHKRLADLRYYIEK